MTPTVEIYGPAGLRSFVRTCMVSTHTRSADKYAVHELLTANDPTTPCTPSDVLHASEFPGRDIRCDIEGFWREFTTSVNLDFGTQLVADAGPIIHRGASRLWP
jgi:ribonuclease Z